VTVTGSNEQRADRRKLQQATFNAPAFMTPWTPAQDKHLLHGSGTIAERAARLGRTYYAACRRLERLRATAPLEAERGWMSR
jgi:hypothetical protein